MKKYGIKNIFIIFVIILLFIGLVYSLLENKIRIKNYNKNITINYNDEYSYDLLKVCYGNYFSCKELKPEIYGVVDTSKIGTYKISYSYKYNNKKLLLKETVKVMDNIKPKIILKDDAIYSCKDGKIYNLYYKAKDNFDGDLTSKVKVTKKDGKVILKVKDSHKNVTIKELDIHKEDNESPKIKLKGYKERNFVVGSNYVDDGVEVKDNCDKNIKVTKKSNVDYNKAGSYEIKYTAKDSSGNTSTVKRIINIKDIDSKDKMVYLTFDDGPSVYTLELLNVLKKYNVKATFFVTNNGDEKIIKRAYDEGHKIGIHSYTHNFAYIYSSIDNYFEDLYKMQEKLKSLTGETITLVRFPSGSSNLISKNYDNGTKIMSTLTKMVEQRGFTYCDWDISCMDYLNEGMDSVKVYNKVISQLKEDRTIVLQHDIRKYSTDSVEMIIKYCIENGYTFDVIREENYIVHHNLNN